MKILSLVLPVLFIALMNGCDASTQSGPVKTGYLGYFSILSLAEDSLYYGELGAINVTDLPDSIDSLKLFVGSVGVPILSVDSGRVRFRVPQDLASGKIRLYKSDTVLAKGSIVLTVLPMHIDMVEGEFIDFAPPYGYVGDKIGISCKKLPLRRRDIKVLVGDVQLPVDSMTREHLFVHITPEMISGKFRVKVLDQPEKNLGDLGKLEHSTSKFMEERTLYQLHVYATQLAGAMDMIRFTPQFDTLSMMKLSTVSTSFSVLQLNCNAQRTGDSVVILSESAGHPKSTLGIRLKVDDATNRASGVFRYTLIDSSTAPEPSRYIEMEVKNMRWLKTNDKYQLFAYSNEVGAMLPTFKTWDYLPSTRSLTTVRSYEGALEGAWIQIGLYFRN